MDTNKEKLLVDFSLKSLVGGYGNLLFILVSLKVHNSRVYADSDSRCQTWTIEQIRRVLERVSYRSMGGMSDTTTPVPFLQNTDPVSLEGHPH